MRNVFKNALKEAAKLILFYSVVFSGAFLLVYPAGLWATHVRIQQKKKLYAENEQIKNCMKEFSHERR